MPRQVHMLEPAGPGWGDPGIREQEHVDGEAIRVFLDSLPEGLGAGFVGVVIISALLHFLGAAAVGAWAALVAGALSICLLAYFRYRAGPAASEDLRRWGRRFVWLATGTALAWGSAAAFFLPADPAVEMLVILGVASVSIGGLGHMAASLPIYLGFLLASELPFALALLRMGDTLHVGIGLGLSGTVVAMTLFAIQTNRSIRHSLLLAFRNRQLAEALEVRTHEAETASLAKSRFLAAASHDLRQPVHAFGLLLEVLRGQGLDARQAETVEQLVRSSEALNGLFDGLLDVSKLDAGAVKPSVRDMELDPLLAALRTEFEPVARAKSLALRIRPTHWSVRTDTVLLGRILRNLLSNAVRYTDRGGVLLGCRRRGERIVIEVWDTGVGIAPVEQGLVFDEFYQCGNRERDRTQGLGLGLAIVHRLASLLEHPLALRSKPGRGSCFRLSVPHVREAAAHADSMPEGRSAVPFANCLVLLVEDDPVVREASLGLLRHWGFATMAFGTAEEVMREAVEWQRAPDLILCDFRLPNGRDGLALIAWLREEFNRSMPALVMTGDIALPSTAPTEHVVVIHKPVPPSRLLAAIGALLGASDSAMESGALAAAC